MDKPIYEVNTTTTESETGHFVTSVHVSGRGIEDTFYLICKEVEVFNKGDKLAVIGDQRYDKTIIYSDRPGKLFLFTPEENFVIFYSNQNGEIISHREKWNKTYTKNFIENILYKYKPVRTRKEDTKQAEECNSDVAGGSASTNSIEDYKVDISTTEQQNGQFITSVFISGRGIQDTVFLNCKGADVINTGDTLIVTGDPAHDQTVLYSNKPGKLYVFTPDENIRTKYFMIDDVLKPFKTKISNRNSVKVIKKMIHFVNVVGMTVEQDTKLSENYCSGVTGASGYRMGINNPRYNVNIKTTKLRNGQFTTSVYITGRGIQDKFTLHCKGADVINTGDTLIVTGDPAHDKTILYSNKPAKLYRFTPDENIMHIYCISNGKPTSKKTHLKDEESILLMEEAINYLSCRKDELPKPIPTEEECWNLAKDIYNEVQKCTEQALSPGSDQNTQHLVSRT